MAKEKVYKLAKEFKVSSEALVQMLKSMGITVKSHMSTVDDNLRDQIRQKFEQERAEIKKQYARKKQKLVKAKEDLYFKPQDDKIATIEDSAIIETSPGQEVMVGETVVTPTQRQDGDNQFPPSGEEGGLRTEHQNKPAEPIAQLPQPVIKNQQRLYETFKPIFNPKQQQTERFQTDRSRPPVVEHLPTPSRLAPQGIESPTPQPSAKPGAALGKKGKKKQNKGKGSRFEIDETELKANVKKTLAKIGAGAEKKKYKKEATEKSPLEQENKKILNVSEFVTVNELANMMQVKVSEVIAKCLELGLFVTINQRLDFETIEMVVDEFGYTAQLMSEYTTTTEDAEEETETDQEQKLRAPVVTVMGHVDHGKTSLLDYIRKTNVIAGEAGGITQHIAAYEVETKHGKITFLDTPGHEAFTAMRARGSQVTDVVVLVVAADSGVMPQTLEAIDHARAANVPIVVAINKTDLPTANVDKVKAELAKHNVLVSDYGGTISSVEISAKTGTGIDRLLEILALETELLELKASDTGKARGVVIESELDKGKGPIATILVQHGTLQKGDPFVTGIHSGRVRDLFNERGISVERALPSQPVIVLGLSGTPQAGDTFKVVGDEKEAREISGRRRLAQKERELRKLDSLSLEHLYEAIQEGQVQTLNLIIKGDVDGSVEALATFLEKLSTDEIKINVIHKSVGAIKETDIMLAATSKAIIIGFHLHPNTKIRELAKEEGVDIRTYRIIYEAIDEVRNAMEGMLAPDIKESIIATCEIRQVFRISKVGSIAGCFVTTGTVRRNAKARLIREDVEIMDTKISSLKRHKEDVREVASGFECGITLDRFNDYQEGDRIEVYEEIEIARKLHTTV
ncbi:MAG: translation initiation factor IF-2 [Chitinivibrionales bacterium]|nr:translation initiation factor IF-2 [Chitinivibrionales bacterium]